MGFLDELKNLAKTAAEQLTYSRKAYPRTSTSKEAYFTTNFSYKASKWSLSEKDALDVYYHGEDKQPGMRCRTYGDYTLCIYHGENKRTGQPYISTIWKRY